MRQTLALLTVATSLTGPASAACAPGQETFLSCTISDGRKSLDVCHDARTATYAFGPTGRTPELGLSIPVAELDYEPWPGVSRTIWEAVTFVSGDVSYRVHGAHERDYGEGEADEVDEVDVTTTGGIEVMQGDAVLATLTCDPGSVEFPWGDGLSEAKRAAGLCLDFASRTWVRCE